MNNSNQLVNQLRNSNEDVNFAHPSGESELNFSLVEDESAVQGEISPTSTSATMGISMDLSVAVSTSLT